MGAAVDVCFDKMITWCEHFREGDFLGWLAAQILFWRATVSLHVTPPSLREDANTSKPSRKLLGYIISHSKPILADPEKCCGESTSRKGKMKRGDTVWRRKAVCEHPAAVVYWIRHSTAHPKVEGSNPDCRGRILKETKTFETRELRFRCSLKNSRLSKFSESATMASLIFITQFRDVKHQLISLVCKEVLNFRKDKNEIVQKSICLAFSFRPFFYTSAHESSP